MFVLVLAAAVVAGQADGDKKANEPPPDRVVLWNAHNGTWRNTGAETVNVYLLYKGERKPTAVALKQPVDWNDGEPRPTVFAYTPVKGKKLARVRVEILTWRGNAGGLAEVEVYRGGELVSRGCMASVSALCKPNDPRDAATLVDGNTSSQKEMVGYWILPERTRGWCEVDLTRTAGGKPVRPAAKKKAPANAKGR